MLLKLLTIPVTVSFDTSSKEAEGMPDLLSSYILADVELWNLYAFFFAHLSNLYLNLLSDIFDILS